MNVVDVYYEEFRENSDAIKKKLFLQDNDIKYKDINNLIKENQHIVIT